MKQTPFRGKYFREGVFIGICNIKAFRHCCFIIKSFSMTNKKLWLRAGKTCATMEKIFPFIFSQF
jgi:hypothetical protein